MVLFFLDTIIKVFFLLLCLDFMDHGKFIYEFIITKFGCSLTLVSDQGVHFISVAIKILTTFFMKHTSSIIYYPHENGQA